MMQHILVTALMMSLTAGPAPAQPAAHPPTVAPEGASPLPLAGQAERARFLGAQPLYTIALYAELGSADPAHLASADMPKALRIAITHQDDVRRPRTRDWMCELVPDLEPAETAHLRRAFAPLQRGDVVIVEYSPSRGTIVRVNRSIAVTGGHHELMLAFLDHWLGQRPVSQEVRRALIGS